MRVDNAFFTYKSTLLNLNPEIVQIDVKECRKPHVDILFLFRKKLPFISGCFLLRWKAALLMLFAFALPIYVVAGNTPAVAVIAIPFISVNCHYNAPLYNR